MLLRSTWFALRRFSSIEGTGLDGSLSIRTGVVDPELSHLFFRDFYFSRSSVVCSIDFIRRSGPLIRVLWFWWFILGDDM